MCTPSCISCLYRAPISDCLMPLVSQSRVSNVGWVGGLENPGRDRGRAPAQRELAAAVARLWSQAQNNSDEFALTITG